MQKFNWNNDWLILLSYFIVAIILRLGSFFPTLIDPDESTYIVMAHQLLHGDLLYIDTVDIKPFGIYAFFYLIIAVFNSILALRIAALFLIVISAWLLFKTKYYFTRSLLHRWLVGVSFVFMMSLPFGLPFNTEILFITCTILGFNLLMVNKGLKSDVLAGVIFGLGFMTKYLVLFDFLALIPILLLVRYWKGSQPNLLLKQFIIVGLGFMIPFITIHVVYLVMNQFQEFRFITYELPFLYRAESSSFQNLGFSLGYHRYYLPLLVFFYLGILNYKQWHSESGIERALVLLWFLMVNFAIFFPGAHFSHYYLQLVPVISFFAFNFLFEQNRIKKYLIDRRGTVVAMVFVLSLCYGGYIFNRYTLEWTNMPDKIAAYLKPRLQEKDILYVVSPHIVQFLTDKKSPARYVHPSLMRKADRVSKFQIDLECECDHIFDVPPKYWVRGEEEACDQFGWKDYYELDTTFTTYESVYRLRKGF